MSKLDDLRKQSEDAIKVKQPRYAEDDKQFSEGVIPAGSITDDPHEQLTGDQEPVIGDEDIDAAAEDDAELLAALQDAQMNRTEALENAKLANRPDAVKDTVTVERTSRTYVLRSGRGEQFPIVYPNGETLFVTFKNGVKTLTGNLMKLFHDEYLTNPAWRQRMQEVDTSAADEIAKEYRNARGTATPGLTANPMAPLNPAAEKEGFIRSLQNQATARGVSRDPEKMTGPVQDQTLLRTLQTESGRTIG